MISVRDLSVRFGQLRALDGLAFEVPTGQSVALWGQNGAGKTTVIRAILGLVPFTGGIRVAGHDARTDGRAVRAVIGYVPQAIALYDDMTTLGYLSYMASLRGVAPDESQRVLEELDLSHQANQRVGALSGGMRQRVALAAAMLGDPPIMILDEPTASLDSTARHSLLDRLVELRHSGKTLLITSHRLDEVSALADRVLTLDAGRLALDGPPDSAAARIGLMGADEATTCLLRLTLAPGSMQAALTTLQSGGFLASRNGHGIHVASRVGDRAAPIVALTRAGISVRDVEVVRN